MQADSNTELRTRLYYVTEDLERIMGRWCEQQGLHSAGPQLFARLRESLQAALTRAFSRPVEDEAKKETFVVEVRYVLRKRLRTLTREDSDGEFWVALDDVCVPRAEAQLDICRIYDEDGLKIGVGARPSGKKLEDQLSHCEDVFNSLADSDTVVVLADDGTYSGNSIVEVACLLRERKIMVRKVNLGFCTNEGQHTIYEKLAERGFPAVELSSSLSVDKARHVYIWVCERDFYLGVPRSGRPYGSLTKTGRAISCEHPIAFPYFEPFAASRRGGDIKRGFVAFSKQQILASLELWSAIEKVNDKKFKVRDIPRFPGPGLHDAYKRHANDDWTEYILGTAETMFPDIRELDAQTRKAATA